MRVNRLSLHRYLLPALMIGLLIPTARGQINSPIPLDVSGLSTSPLLRWMPFSGAVNYHLQVSSDASFSAFTSDDSTLTDTVQMVDPLLPDTGYYWRVRVRTNSGFSNWSLVNRFYAVRGESVYTYKMPLVLIPPENSPKFRPKFPTPS
ncbi:MAG: hypothetical protein E6K56_00200 [Ignavibacteria bacterium]|nr:MAG: hypothetical protein E6K56_00200 [Ignavibacteria bacterium]